VPALSFQNDKILYIEKHFCYSKFTEKIEIGAQEVMFTGQSYDPVANKPILKVAAHQELAQILASCLGIFGHKDLILIRADLEWLAYDDKTKVLVLNQPKAERQRFPLKNAAAADDSIMNETQSEKLEIIRFATDVSFRINLQCLNFSIL
jgi:hypothetical protein